jgi:hypothetical protein
MRYKIIQNNIEKVVDTFDITFIKKYLREPIKDIHSLIEKLNFIEKQLILENKEKDYRPEIINAINKLPNSYSSYDLKCLLKQFKKTLPYAREMINDDLIHNIQILKNRLYKYIFGLYTLVIEN